jgi:hypothetical protein
MMSIRRATPDDVEAMISLADKKRTEYAEFAPTFWRKAVDGLSKQRLFFHTLLSNLNVIALVHEDNQGVNGFLIASLIDAPPVYDPGSQVCMIDDFTVTAADKWMTIGRSLLDAVREYATAQGVQLMLVVCGHLDEPKRTMLRDAGFGIASEWYVNPL